MEISKLLLPLCAVSWVVDGPVTRGFDKFYRFHHTGAISSIVEDDKIVCELDLVEVLPSLTEQVVKHIDAKASEAKLGKPFFAYFPTSSPHSPVVPSAA